MSLYDLVDAFLNKSTAAARPQAAYVRTILDEIERHHPSERCIADLHQQLGEELERLAHLSPGVHVDENEPVDILVVDDDESSLVAVSKAVNGLGYVCRTANDAQHALKVHGERPASIVLSDWQMPGMSGLELCQHLKREQVPPYVMLMTAHESDCVLDGLRSGVDDFLPKPIELAHLEARLLPATRLLRAMRAVSRA